LVCDLAYTVSFKPDFQANLLKERKESVKGEEKEVVKGA